MNTSRKQVFLIALTMLTLGAGVVVGMVASRLPGARIARDAAVGADGMPAQPAGLAEQLQLTPPQRDQMRKIWEGVRDQVRSSFANAEGLQKQRDDEVFAMLTDEQKSRFESISKRYGDRFTALRDERDAAFRQAVEQTRILLNDEQRAKYDELLKTHVRPEATSPDR